MFDFFEKVLGFFETVFEFFLNTIESLFTAINTLTTSLTLPSFLVGFVPSFFGSAIIIISALAVVKFIIGR